MTNESQVMSVIGTERSQMISCSGNRARPDIERRHECQGSLVIESYYFLTKESKVMSVIGTERSQMVDPALKEIELGQIWNEDMRVKVR